MVEENIQNIHEEEKEGKVQAGNVEIIEADEVSPRIETEKNQSVGDMKSVDSNNYNQEEGE